MGALPAWGRWRPGVLPPASSPSAARCAVPANQTRSGHITTAAPGRGGRALGTGPAGKAGGAAGESAQRPLLELQRLPMAGRGARRLGRSARVEPALAAGRVSRGAQCDDGVPGPWRLVASPARGQGVSEVPAGSQFTACCFCPCVQRPMMAGVPALQAEDYKFDFPVCP